jgi:high affinity Mn2+ porin
VRDATGREEVSGAAGALLAALLILPTPLAAQEAEAGPSGPAWWSLHFQQTVVSQHHGSFPAAYSGRNSLRPGPETSTSITATLFAGARLWRGAGLYFNPELSGGDGLSNVSGVAGFPNGETYRVGQSRPTVVVGRIFVEQVFGFGEATEAVSDEANQLPGRRARRRLTFRLGKFSLTDFFDDNRYSHDPRGQFLNWALMGNGAWDYAADTRGYTWGVTGEFQAQDWAVRAAAVMVPVEANGLQLDTRIADAHALNVEVERGYRLAGRPGVARVMLYRNLARMGSYREAIVARPVAPDLVPTRRYGRDKNGLGLNLEQELGAAVGVFLRAGWNDGRNETWAFTEIDRALTLGASAKGTAWHRAGDRLAGALILSGLSGDHRGFLAAGGYGFIIGDGALRYGCERILEAYYSLALPRGLSVTGDVQRIVNPAYNRDRGPVNVAGVRVHLGF